MTRAALYIRVSSPDHAATRDRQHPDMQESELRAFCQARGWEPRFVFEDHASGAKSDRAELAKLMAVCRRRQVDVVLVWRYDRFARSVTQLVGALDEFRTLGVDFVSVHEQMDTTTPQGKLLFTMLAGLAEFNREMIRANVKAGLAAAYARGAQKGRPVTYDAGLPARVREKRAAGGSWRSIARQLGISVNMTRRLALLPPDAISGRAGTLENGTPLSA